MSQVCTCKNAIIVTTPGQKDPHCERCGYWWIPKHGSTEPIGSIEINHRLRGEQLKAKENFSGKRVSKNKSFWMLKRNNLGG